MIFSHRVVISVSKIQILKQITTFPSKIDTELSCYQCVKDTNFKANHNFVSLSDFRLLVVISVSKIQILKQITTTK